MTQQAIFKHETDPFTITPIALLELSPAAYYLYGYIKSKPSGWVFHKQHVLKEIKMGKYTFYRGLKELEDAGYLTREQINEKGKFGTVVYTLLSTCKKDNHRVPKNRIRKIGTHNYIDSNLKKEKNKNKKETSLRDNSKYPFGVVTLKETIMSKLEDLLPNIKQKTKEAQERKEQKKEQRASAFENKKNNAELLQDYFYSLLNPKDRAEAKLISDANNIYRIANDCKNVGITSFEDQKRVLDFFVANWPNIRKMMYDLHYGVIETFPNLLEITMLFFKVGYISCGFGLNIDRMLFKKEK